MFPTAAIDTARLKRSRDLKVVQLSTYEYRVASERSDYTVDLRDRLHPKCDCYDGARNLCKHSLAALRAAGEPSVLEALGEAAVPVPPPAAPKLCACGRKPLHPGQPHCVLCEFDF